MSAAFKAGFADWKLIKTRGVVQLVFEVPLNEADAAYQVVGGMPDPASERWFGIARLNTGAESVSGLSGPAPAREAELSVVGSASRPRKPVAVEKRLAQQAAICCNDPVFRRYLKERGYSGGDADQAADTVRFLCGVVSRSEIVPGTTPGNAWRNLHADFEAWRLVA